MSLSSIRRELRSAVRQRDPNQCRYCRLRQVGQAAVFHIDHIVPRSKGGDTAVWNLVLQCPYCSLRKSDKIDGADPESGEKTPLFHPLQQNWGQHFSRQRDGTIVGLTAVGRVTKRWG
jgi:5-methylcytosine-specific restriction endonuclease McrA